MTEKHIDFVREFTDCPGGRLRIHGEFSGEQFRDDILRPALNSHEKVVVHLNGAVGFPSSFIDEVFGVISEELGYEVTKRKLEIELSDDPMALREIEECMLDHRRKV